MLRVGTQILNEMRVGTQKIKEAWVGATKVFSSFVSFIGELLQGKNWAIQPISDTTAVLGSMRVWYPDHNDVIFEKGKIGGRNITSTIKLSKTGARSGLMFALYDGDSVVESKTISTTATTPQTSTVTFDHNISNYALHIVGYQTANASRVQSDYITIS